MNRFLIPKFHIRGKNKNELDCSQGFIKSNRKKIIENKLLLNLKVFSSNDSAIIHHDEPGTIGN